jgi:hypothetical protein
MASTTANPPADKPASSGKFKRIALIAVIALARPPPQPAACTCS